MLTSWRSEIGKAGISAVEALWGSNEEEYGTEEQRQEYAEGTLLGLKYLYKFPDQTVSATCLPVRIRRLIKIFARLSAGHFVRNRYRQFFRPILRRFYTTWMGMGPKLELWL
jgi:hypothetical protein